ncbi:cellobiose ABC transporter membrane protein [Pseudonocardia thermophila]|jgi:ABC-type sugar transport system, permease component|uniref:Cellobiose ABC transporter membrane protein n=1 Tax=Pseudonocardia thermophila TaxID=1848 RepID=A0A1M6U846_PSETH|nr:carbohydrate ABC transporter permease [Pseudonocardia thermophila]SHK65341.1 cellobiose ABC transporter membrane protein [Pseudonocardia thermophila]
MTVTAGPDTTRTHRVSTRTVTEEPPARRRTRRGVTSAGPLACTVLGVTAVLFVLPFYYMIVAASRPMSEMAQLPPPMTPGPLLLDNIEKALAQQDLGLALANTFFVAGVVTVSTVLLCTLAGFAFAKLRFRGRTQLFGLAVGTMMIPPSLGVVPLYSLMVALGLAGNLASVILPSLVGAFGVFFMRQYVVQALPDELLDAAKIDGATMLRTFWSVVLPICRPGMAVLAMLTFMTTWNDFFWPVITLDSSNPTVQVALANLGTGYVPDTSVIMAGTLVGTLPVIVVFLLLGRQIVGGIIAGAVKG